MARDIDPFEMAFGKYMPYDHFVEFVVRNGKVYIDNKEVRGAIKTQQGEKALVVEFLKGK